MKTTGLTKVIKHLATANSVSEYAVWMQAHARSLNLKPEELTDGDYYAVTQEFDRHMEQTNPDDYIPEYLWDFLTDYLAYQKGDDTIKPECYDS